MDVFAEYLARIENPQHRERTQQILGWVAQKFPGLGKRVAWNQPMFTDHDTFIIGFSVSRHHLAVAPEKAGIERFSEAVVAAGYAHTKELIRIPWESPVDYELLDKMIAFNIADKADCPTFWRK